MSQDSKIEWTHHTFNPWWGCTKISEGCKNCYAATFAHRYGHEVWGKSSPRRFFGEHHWKEPLKWNAEAKQSRKRHRVFCASMADVFEDNLEQNPTLNEERQKLWNLILKTPQLDWLLLTKRPYNILKFIPSEWRNGLPQNIWAGTSVENQQVAETLIPHLVKVPASIRFLSIEPLIEAIPKLNLDGVDWVIVGGESGAGSRPMQEQWVLDIKKQCNENNVKFFFKQWGGFNKKKSGRLLLDREWNAIPKPEHRKQITEQLSLAV
jgi:protein gp37